LNLAAIIAFFVEIIVHKLAKFNKKWRAFVFLVKCFFVVWSNQNVLLKISLYHTTNIKPIIFWTLFLCKVKFTLLQSRFFPAKFLFIYLNLRPQWLCPLRGSITKKLQYLWRKKNFIFILEKEFLAGKNLLCKGVFFLIFFNTKNYQASPFRVLVWCQRKRSSGISTWKYKYSQKIINYLNVSNDQNFPVLVFVLNLPELSRMSRIVYTLWHHESTNYNFVLTLLRAECNLRVVNPNH
jgi:hypothetical protein